MQLQPICALLGNEGRGGKMMRQCRGRFHEEDGDEGDPRHGRES